MPDDITIYNFHAVEENLPIKRQLILPINLQTYFYDWHDKIRANLLIISMGII